MNNENEQRMMQVCIVCGNSFLNACGALRCQTCSPVLVQPAQPTNHQPIIVKPPQSISYTKSISGTGTTSYTAERKGF